MKFLKISFCFGLVASISFPLKASAKNYSFEFRNNKERSLQSIVNYFTDKKMPYDEKSKHIRLIKLKNPDITDWERIPPGTKFKIYIPEEAANQEKIIKHVKGEKSSKSTYHLDAGLGIRLRTDTIKGGGENISLNGQSYQSFHFSGTYQREGGLSLMSNGRFSSFRPIDINNEGNDTITFRPDYDLSLLAGYPVGPMKTTFFGGLMYSRFSTFDSTAFEERDALEQITSKIIYATIGGRQAFLLEGNKAIELELSLSPVLSFKTDSGDSGNGFRYHLGTNFLFQNRYILFGNFDSHSLSFAGQDLTSREITVGGKVRF